MTNKISTSSTPSEIVDAINEINNAIPSVGNGTVEFTQDGTSLGSITMNQSGNSTIEIAGASGIVDQTFDPTSPRPQSGVAIAGEGYLKQHQDLSHLQLKSNLVTELNQNVTNQQYPSAKTVYDSLANINTEAHGDWVASYLEISTSGSGLYDLSAYFPSDADEYWYEVLFNFAGYDKSFSDSTPSNSCTLRTLFYYLNNNNDLLVGALSSNSRFFRNIFTLVFPPGSKTEVIPYNASSSSGAGATKFYCTHCMGLYRDAAYNSFLATARAYRRLGKTPYTNYPSTVPIWLRDYYY